MFTRFTFSSAIGWTLVLIFLCEDCTGSGKRNWEFEPLSLVGTSPDAKKIDVTTKIERVSRGVFSLSATFITGLDFDESVMIEAVGYRSPSGAEEEYKLLPWSIPKQTFKQFVETHYKDIVYPNVKDCSNFPPPDKAFPWPKNNYKLNKCVPNGDGLPVVAPEGYYKLIITISGNADLEVVAITKLSMNNVIG